MVADSIPRFAKRTMIWSWLLSGVFFAGFAWVVGQKTVVGPLTKRMDRFAVQQGALTTDVAGLHREIATAVKESKAQRDETLRVIREIKAAVTEHVRRNRGR